MYGCITNYPEIQQLKKKNKYFFFNLISVSQEPGHGLARASGSESLTGQNPLKAQQRKWRIRFQLTQVVAGSICSVYGPLHKVAHNIAAHFYQSEQRESKRRHCFEIQFFKLITTYNLLFVVPLAHAFFNLSHRLKEKNKKDISYKY